MLSLIRCWIFYPVPSLRRNGLKWKHLLLNSEVDRSSGKPSLRHNQTFKTPYPDTIWAMSSSEHTAVVSRARSHIGCTRERYIYHTIRAPYQARKSGLRLFLGVFPWHYNKGYKKHDLSLDNDEKFINILLNNIDETQFLSIDHKASKTGTLDLRQRKPVLAMREGGILF